MPITVPNSDPVARAQQSAQVKYGGQEDAIKRAIASLAVTRAADEAALNQYGTSGKQAINTTYGDLFSNLEASKSNAAQDLGTQVNLVGQGYRDANQIAEAARQQGVSNLQSLFGSNEAFKAGSLGAAVDPIESLAARLIGNNAMNDATVSGNLRTWAAQHDAIRGAGIAGAQRDKADRLGGFESELMRALAESKNSATNQEYDFQSELLDLLNERGSFTVEQTNALADMLFNQQLQAAQYNLSEQEAMSLAAARNAASSGASNDDYWKQKNYELALRAADRADLEAMGGPKPRFAGASARAVEPTLEEKLAIADRLAADPTSVNIMRELGVPGVGGGKSLGASGSKKALPMPRTSSKKSSGLPVFGLS